MEIKKKELDVYLVEGKEFFNKSDAEEYEKQLKKELDYTYYTITHTPDLTEGRGYYKQTVIAVPDNYAQKATALKYCFDILGKPLVFVQGCCPTPNWILGDAIKFDSISKLNKFKQQKVSEGIGDYRKMVEKKIIYLDSKGEII